MIFADRLQASIEKRKSVLCAGLDPDIELFPDFILAEADKASRTTEEYIEHAIVSLYTIALEALAPHVACVKPNMAFYEQYGFGGLRALSKVMSLARDHGLPIIIDAKRGDIGNTASAYARASLGGVSVRGQKIDELVGDALTVNPYLGFDTLEPFIVVCEAEGKGLFVLVRTSNPGSAELQNIKGSGATVGETVAEFLAKNADRLRGTCGLSGLGAVVGAPHREEAAAIRKIMPTNYFLIPGVGAQGGSMDDARAGFIERSGFRSGAVVNVSRGLFGESRGLGREQLKAALAQRAVGVG